MFDPFEEYEFDEFDVMLSGKEVAMNGETHLEGGPAMEPMKFAWRWRDPLRCSIAAQNLDLAIVGDSHSVYVQGTGNNISVTGENIHLRVDGENNNVHINGEGAFLYSTSRVSLGGPSNLAGLGDLNSPDCPAMLPSKLKRDASLHVPANHWFLDLVIRRQARASPTRPVDDENDNEDDGRRRCGCNLGRRISTILSGCNRNEDAESDSAQDPNDTANGEDDTAPADPSHSQTISVDDGDSANSVTEDGRGTQTDEDEETTNNSRKRTSTQAGISTVEGIEKIAKK